MLYSSKKAISARKKKVHLLSHLRERSEFDDPSGLKPVCPLKH